MTVPAGLYLNRIDPSNDISSRLTKFISLCTGYAILWVSLMLLFPHSDTLAAPKTKQNHGTRRCVRVRDAAVGFQAGAEVTGEVMRLRQGAQVEGEGIRELPECERGAERSGDYTLCLSV